MKKYFLYELKKNAFAIGCIALVASALYVTVLLSSRDIGLTRGDVYLYNISVTGGVLAAAVPVWIFSYKMKKRSVDLYYSLPLPHTQILTVKFLIGLIAVFAPYTVAYWLGTFTAMAKATYHIHAIYYIPNYFATIIPIYIIYAMSAFVFTRANKLGDGILFIAFWALALVAIALVIEGFVDYNPFTAPKIYPFMFAPYTPLDIVTTAFQELMTGDTHQFQSAEIFNFAVGTAVNVALAAGATVGLFLSEKQAKAENCEQISDSFFGYKVMIPLYTVCLITLSEMEFILLALVATGAYGLTAIYKRTLKIGQNQAIVLISAIIAGIILSVIYTYAY